MSGAPKKLCFIGDSLIEYCNWQVNFPNHTVANFGLSGETTRELRDRLGLVTSSTYCPDAVILMVGTNDLLMGEDFLPSYEEIILTMQRAWPRAAVLANGLMPMALAWLPINTITSVNSLMEELALRYKIGYLDGCRLLHNCEYSTCFLEDGVHLSSHGYAIWCSAIGKYLQQIGCID